MFFSHIFLWLPFLPLTLAAEPIHIPLVRRTNVKRDIASIMAAADGVRLRYGYPVQGPQSRKRAGVANVQIIDQGQDSSYFASVNIGTPPQTMNVVLDTGSSDLWVADSQCTSCPNGTPVFKPSLSTTAELLSSSSARVDLTYGSGQVSGLPARDVVSMAGFSITKQIFVAVDDVSQNFLTGSVSGIMGLAFTTLARTEATPFWLALAQSNQFTSPEMSFYLGRLVNVDNVPLEAPAGVFTLGGTNSSLYTGDIEFLNIIGNPNTFWLLTISEVTVQGKTIPITTGSAAIAAIDTGTTLIGGPSRDVAAIYNAIPGAQQAPNSGGLYAFPCNTKVTVTMSFGGKTWAINSADMVVAQVSPQSSYCIGGIFDLAAGTNIPPNSGNPSWVVGDTFLKNVYAVFRANPASVGFAQLSSIAGGSGATSSSSGTGGLNSPGIYPTSTVTITPQPTGGTSSSNHSPPSALDGKRMIVTLLTCLVIVCSI